MKPSLALIFWREVWLSLILWAELLCLVAAMILHYIGQASVRRNPDDYVYHFAKVWWATFRLKPSPIKAPKMIDVDADEEEGRPLMDLIDEEAIAELGKAKEEEEEEGDERGAEERGGVEQAGMRVATLQVRVVTQQGADEIVGWVGQTLKIRVTAGQDGGQANKAVIELLASTLGVRAHQVQLRRGHYEEQKVLAIAGLTQGEMEERLGGA